MFFSPPSCSPPPSQTSPLAGHRHPPRRFGNRPMGGFSISRNKGPRGKRAPSRRATGNANWKRPAIGKRAVSANGTKRTTRRASPVRLFCVRRSQSGRSISQQQPLLVIPHCANCLRHLHPKSGRRIGSCVSAGADPRARTFHYQGLFAEHLARVSRIDLAKAWIQPHAAG